MTRYKITLSYDGTNYSGWQIQLKKTSIQFLIQEALKILLKEKISLIGAGRTDAQVHALEQTAHFSTDKNLDIRKFIHSLNGILPKDIRILSIEPQKDSFHARYSAKGKIYRYHISLGPYQSPFKKAYSYHVKFPVNIPLLKKTLFHFIGEKNFKSFANDCTKGSSGKNPIRTIKRIDVIESDDGIILEFEGNGFLYKMIRNIVGTLLEINKGKIPLEDLHKIFAATDRKKAGTTAPAHALFLVKVLY